MRQPGRGGGAANGPRTKSQEVMRVGGRSEHPSAPVLALCGLRARARARRGSSYLAVCLFDDQTTPFGIAMFVLRACEQRAVERAILRTCDPTEPLRSGRRVACPLRPRLRPLFLLVWGASGVQLVRSRRQHGCTWAVHLGAIPVAFLSQSGLRTWTP